MAGSLGTYGLISRDLWPEFLGTHGPSNWKHRLRRWGKARSLVGLWGVPMFSRAFAVSEARHRRRMLASRRGQRRVGVLTRGSALLGVARLGRLVGYPKSARPRASRIRGLVVLMLVI